MKMKGVDKNIRLIFSCNTNGVAEQILLDSEGLFETIEFPIGLHSLVSADSMDALAGLWLKVMENSMEENITISMQPEDRKIEFTFSGYLLKDKVLLCGSTELSSTEKALGEIMLINNEQQNRIRLTEKKLSSLQREEDKQELDEDFLNEFSHLNNELINKQRELIQKNAKILQLNKKLEKANESMKMFTYSVSHDLREPVRMVKSFMNLFQQKYSSGLDEKARNYVDFAVDGANHLDKIIKDLLEYYRATNITATETVDLNNVVKEVQQLLKKQIEDKNAQIASDSLPVFQGSSTGWRQVFQNLISNAIKFVPDDRIPVIKLAAEETDGKWQISVSDNGIGIAPEHREDIFDFFKRGNNKKEFEGTGMGLAIVKKIVHNLEGKIRFESELNKGTTFYITLKKTDEKLPD